MNNYDGYDNDNDNSTCGLHCLSILIAIPFLLECVLL